MYLRKKLNFFRKINIKLSIIFTLFFGLIIFATTGFTFLNAYQSLKRDNEEVKKSILLTYWVYYKNFGRASTSRYINRTLEKDFSLVLVNENGYILATSQIYDDPYKIQRRENENYFTTGSLTLGSSAVLHIKLYTGGNREILTMMKKQFINIIIPFIVISFAGGMAIANYSLSPISKINKQIKKISDSSDYTRHLSNRGTGDHLDQLSGHINQFLTKIDSQIEGMKQTLNYTAHDLRTPLTRFRGGAERALLNNDINHEELVDALSQAVEESQIISKMLNTIMDISEAEKGVLKLYRQECNLEKILNEMIDLYSFFADTKNITLKKEFNSPKKIIEADSSRLRQIIGNLLDNAIKYSEDESEVLISTLYDKTNIYVKVIDKGSGIEKNNIALIWDRLFREEKSRTTKGLGLGLSLVKALTEAHKWHIDVESTISKGSIFTITIPVNDLNKFS